jgi:hypothetical protein
MQPLAHAAIIAAYRRSERKLVSPPPDPDWASLDYLSWLHKSGHLGFVVAETPTGLAGLALERRVIRSPKPRRFMCDLCCTLHEQGDIASFTRWNRGKTRSRSHLICADLGCSLYVRGLRESGCAQMSETIDLVAKIDRLAGNVATFVANMTWRLDL